MAQTTKKKTVTVKDLNVVVTKLTSDMVMHSKCVLEMVEKVNTMDKEAVDVTKLTNDMIILFNRVNDMDERVNSINTEAETSELATLLKDMDGKVKAFNVDVWIPGIK